MKNRIKTLDKFVNEKLDIFRYSVNMSQEDYEKTDKELKNMYGERYFDEKKPVVIK